MKTLLTSTLASAALLASVAGAYAFCSGPDTILVKLKKADKLMIITRPGQSGVQSLKEYDINGILAKVDSALQATQVISMTSGRDTTLVIRQIRSTNNPGDEKKSYSVSFSTKNGAKLVVKERYGDIDTVVRLNRNDNGTPQPGDNRHKRRSRHNHGSMFYLNLGLNNYLTPQGRFIDGSSNPELSKYALRTGGSRYVAIGYGWRRSFGNSPFGVNWGLEFAWQNFMLQDDYRFIKDSNSVGLQDFRNDPDISVIKSKLVQCNIKLPLTIDVYFGRGWHLDAGGFVGYRIDSYTKFRFVKDGDDQKDHHHSNFAMENFQYGYKAQLRHEWLGLFAEYHANPLFNHGPDLRAFQFGVSFQ